MKKLLLPFFGILFSLNVISQTNKVNLVIFSEDGDKFFLVINGIRQNMTGETNVRLTDLTTESFSIKVIFEDTKIPAISKTQYLPFGSEYTMRIKTDKKGNRALKPFGQTELSQPSTSSGATTIIYHTTEEVPVTTNTTGTNISTNVSGTGNGATSNVNVSSGVNETTSSTTTTTTTTTSTGGTTSNTGSTGIGMNVNIEDNTSENGGNVSTGVNVGGVGMNIDINVSENGANINMGGTGMDTGSNKTETTTTTSGGNVVGTSTSTYTSTTTTTTTSTSGGLGTTTNVTGVNTSGNSTSTSTLPSNSGCNYAMGTTDFASAKKSIESKDFEDSKFTVAKQVTKSNCLSAAQIKEIMELFDFEATKLDYAKYAYDFCYDKKNYYQLNDAFDFESSIDDLNSYIEKK